MRMIRMLAAVVVLAMVLAACSSSGNEMDVSLYEWGVDPSPTSVDAGEVTFNVTNDGGENHEMVIVKGIAPDDLPIADDGHVDEDQIPEDAFVGEVEEIEAGSTDSATFDLEAGTYTIFCNIVETDDGETESHFHNGMVSTFTVEG